MSFSLDGKKIVSASSDDTVPNYVHIQEASRHCTLFIAIGTSGTVIDIVPIAKAFKHSVIVDPKPKETKSVFDPCEYVDEYFEQFIQKKVTDAMKELMEIVREHLKCEKR